MKRKRVSVHKPGWPIRALVLSVGLLAAGIHVFGLRMFAGTGGIPLVMVPLVLLLDALILWWGIVFTTQSNVTLYEEGIELQRGTSKIFTTWDNISHMGVRRFGRNRQTGFYLHEHAHPGSTGLIDRIFFGRKTKFLPVGQYARMPMTWNIFNPQVDQEKLVRTEFGKALHDVAPQLFDDYEPPKLKYDKDIPEAYYSEWLKDDSQPNKHKQKNQR